MAWVLFSERAAFDAWHVGECAERGIPRPGRFPSAPAIMAQWTDAWVNVEGAFVAAPNSYLLVRVPDDETAGLTLAQADPVFHEDGTLTIVHDGVTRTVFRPAVEDWRQPKPATVTIDGVTYDTATGEVIP